jgi:uncharacterized membrane protein
MRETILTNWNFMRWLRLFMGAYIVITSITGKNYVFALIGGLFVFQAITNIGCAACAAVPSSKAEKKDTENIEFEEIKSDLK